MSGVDMGTGNLRDGGAAGPGPAARISRRDFLAASGLVAAGCGGTAWAAAEGEDPGIAVRFGIVSDAHYADRDPAGSRAYRESLSKMRECVDRMNEERVGFLIELGDLKDEDPGRREEDTLGYLRAVEEVLGGFRGPRYHVLGNHDMDSISKAQFGDVAENTGIPTGAGHYAFAAGGVRFVVLDANYTRDGRDYDHGNFDWTDANIPPGQRAWLQEELRAASGPVVVFVHQQLDGADEFCVRQAEDIRAMLEAHGGVLAVFQGHNHPGRHRRIGGIHYYTLRAMVEGTGAENNAYAVVEVRRDGDLRVTGYRRAAGLSLPRAAEPPPG
jgi:predicted phosphodiesterase